MRQSNRHAKEAAEREVANRFDRVLENLQTDAKTREVWLVATEGADRAPLENPAGLNRDDLTLLALTMYRLFQQFHSQHRARIDGALDDRQWQKILPWIRMHLVTESALDWWAWGRDGTWFDDDFTAFIDREVETLRREGASKVIYWRSS